jgi:hypothetical protein
MGLALPFPPSRSFPHAAAFLRRDVIGLALAKGGAAQTGS